MESTPEVSQSIEPEQPQHNEVVVDFLRHGKSQYGREKELTPEGEQQVEHSADQLVESIDPDRDTVVLWSSPNPRAQESEAIIKQKLETKGIPIYKDSTIGSMRAFDQRDQKEMEQIWRDIFSQGLSRDQVEVLYAKDKLINPNDPRYAQRKEILEGPEEVRRRTERVMNWTRYLAEHANLQGRRLRILGASHAEFLDPILEDVFAYNVEQEGAIKQAEPIRLTFNFNPDAKRTNISAEFRGQTRTGIAFDSEKRKFIAAPEPR